MHLNFLSVEMEVWLVGKFISSSAELCPALHFPHTDRKTTHEALHRWDLDGKWLFNHIANKHVGCLSFGSICFLKSYCQERHFSPSATAFLFLSFTPQMGKTKDAKITLAFVSPSLPWRQMLRSISVAGPKNPPKSNIFPILTLKSLSWSKWSQCLNRASVMVLPRTVKEACFPSVQARFIFLHS